MASAATYEIVFLGGPRGETSRFRSGAPSDAMICELGARYKSEFATRYFPSRKGWIVFDLRKARKVRTSGHRDFWTGCCRLRTVCPNKEAAIMLAYHAAMRCPKLDLDQ